jgi:hypothetical protein
MQFYQTSFPHSVFFFSPEGCSGAPSIVADASILFSSFGGSVICASDAWGAPASFTSAGAFT